MRILRCDQCGAETVAPGWTAPGTPREHNSFLAILPDGGDPAGELELCSWACAAGYALARAAEEVPS